MRTRTPKRSVDSTALRHRRLSAGRFMRAVVQQQMREVAARTRRAWRTRHAHQGGAVAVERDHLQVRPRQREAERHGVTHPIDPTRTTGSRVVDGIEFAPANPVDASTTVDSTGVLRDHALHAS